MSKPWYAHRPVAHRGLHEKEGRDENSFEAFVAAIEAGHPIECDVHLTLDDELVIHHDDNTLRMTGENYVIADSYASDLVRLTTKNSQRNMMYLTELLHLCNGQVPLLIELKATQQVKRLAAATMKTLAGYEGEYAIQSFDPFVLMGLRMLAPHMTLGLLSGTFKNYKMPKYQKYLLKNFSFAPIIKPDFIALEMSRGKEEKVQKLRRDYPLLAWTIDQVEDLEFCRQYFDNIIFEFFEPGDHA